MRICSSLSYSETKVGVNFRIHFVGLKLSINLKKNENQTHDIGFFKKPLGLQGLGQLYVINIIQIY